MKRPGSFGSGVMAVTLLGLAVSLTLPCQAEPDGDGDFAALQADAKKTFRESVAPFIKDYCVQCHGNRRSKAGINFEVAVKNPGDAAFSRPWKQALAKVKTHDMPPEEANKQPTDKERQVFLDWIAQIKYLSPKDPGIFVIRRLTKVEYGNTLHDLFGVDPGVV